jgi:hypothetical protein
VFFKSSASNKKPELLPRLLIFKKTDQYMAIALIQNLDSRVHVQIEVLTSYMHRLRSYMSNLVVLRLVGPGKCSQAVSLVPLEDPHM